MTDRGKHKESTGASQLRDENTKLRAMVDFLEQERGGDEDPRKRRGHGRQTRIPGCLTLGQRPLDDIACPETEASANKVREGAQSSEQPYAPAIEKQLAAVRGVSTSFNLLLSKFLIRPAPRRDLKSVRPLMPRDPADLRSRNPMITSARSADACGPVGSRCGDRIAMFRDL